MATGNPILATLATDNTLRTYELGVSGFVQTGASALTWGTAYRPPNLSWHQDGKFLLTSVCVTSNTANSSRVWSPTLVAQAAATTYADQFVRDTIPENSVAIHNLASVATGFTSNYVAWWRIEADGTINNTGALTMPSGVTTPAATVNVSVSISPDGSILVFGRNSSNANVVVTSSGGMVGGSKPAYDAYYNLPLSTSVVPNIMKWTRDSNLLFVVDTADKIYVCRRSGLTLSSIGTIVHATLGAPTGIALSYDTRWVAVSYATATCLYYRTGDTFSLMQTLTGTMGPVMDFTLDGKYLVDATHKTAWQRSGMSWSNVNSIMTNIASNVAYQAMSPHVNNPVGNCKLYDGALARVMTSIPTTIKIMLLSASATFVTTATNITALSAFEVSGNGWPSGGSTLANAAFTATGSTGVIFDADDVKATIAGGSLTFQKAVVYDTSDNKPLVYIDFNSSQLAEENASIVINFGSNGMILFTP